MDSVFSTEEFTERGQLLASSIVHDLNNLLLVIHFMGEELLAGLPTDDPNRRTVMAIQDARNRAFKLARQLQEIHRSGVEGFEYSTIDLNELVAHSETLLRRLVRDDVIFTVKYSSSPAIISANPDKADRIVLNLVLNALISVPNGGWVTIETCHEDLTYSRVTHEKLPPGRYIRLTITDTGCGTEEVRSPNGISNNQAGAVFPLVQKIIEECGGQIDVKSSSEQGTRVEVRLPAVSDVRVRPVVEEPPQPTTDTPTTSSIAARNETIVLVEDEEAVRRLVLKFLQTQGYTVIVAANGNEALSTLRNSDREIDLLLTDVTMPEMTGPQLAEVLKPIFPKMKVLFVSGYTDDTIVRHGILNSNIAFLQKPFTSSVLLKKVRQVLDFQN